LHPNGPPGVHPKRAHIVSAPTAARCRRPASQMSTRKAKCVLVFMGKSDSTRPRPALFIRHVVAYPPLRLHRTLPAIPRRPTAQRSRLVS
jgi:hypothetical protein